ncbi:hypothetical protein DFH09DRAFT_1344133 [Mycena vulgaris]|nr:hypothetical protein DFH09DRAFT_1344133 [Mycena vulgaris]
MSVLEVAKKNKAVVPVSLYLKKEALQKGHMTSALKIWLNPDLVDVKRFVRGPRPGYVSFYDRKIAHFKARDKRRALLMKQRNAPPDPLLRLFRRRRPTAPPTNTAANLCDQAQTQREEAEKKEVLRIRDLRVAYLLSLRGVPVRPYWIANVLLRDFRMQKMIDGRRTYFHSQRLTFVSLLYVPHATGRVHGEEEQEKGGLTLGKDPPHTALYLYVTHFLLPTTSPEPSLTESIAESLPAATPEPHEAEDWRVGWDRMVEEIKAANRAIADENWVETLPPPPELTAEQAAEEAAKDTACANAIRICVAAMSEPERRYWQDEEEREARLERQREIWRMEEERVGVDNVVWKDYTCSSTGMDYVDL